MDGNMMDNKLKIEYVNIKSIKMYSIANAAREVIKKRE